MKTVMCKVVVTGIMLVFSFVGLAQQNSGTVKARKNVAESNKELKQGKQDSAADFKKFKINAEMAIKENEEKITALKAEKSSKNKESNDNYNKKVQILEQKNDLLKNKIKNCETVNTNMWTTFKSEFNHDMSELGKAIKDFGVNNND